MKVDVMKPVSEFLGPKPLMVVFLGEWRWLVPGAVFSLLLTGLIPNLDIPALIKAMA